MKFLIYTWYFLRSVALRGPLGTLRLLKAEMAYDKKFGITTAAIKESSSADFFHYQGAAYRPLLRILERVHGETGDIEFIDIGCGKGRAVFMAEYCGYNQLKGIELHHDLIEEAIKNLHTYTFRRQASSIQFITANALEARYRNTPAVYFMFNPFSEAIMRSVLEKILSSTSSETWFVYMNPRYTLPFTERNMRPVMEFKTFRYLEALVYKVPAKD